MTQYILTRQGYLPPSRMLPTRSLLVHGKTIPPPKSQIINSEGFTLETPSGFEVFVPSKANVLVFENEKHVWKSAQDLQEGDQICIDLYSVWMGDRSFCDFDDETLDSYSRMVLDIGESEIEALRIQFEDLYHWSFEDANNVLNLEGHPDLARIAHLLLSSLGFDVRRKETSIYFTEQAVEELMGFIEGECAWKCDRYTQTSLFSPLIQRLVRSLPTSKTLPKACQLSLFPDQDSTPMAFHDLSSFYQTFQQEIPGEDLTELKKALDRRYFYEPLQKKTSSTQDTWVGRTPTVHINGFLLDHTPLFY